MPPALGEARESNFFEGCGSDQYWLRLRALAALGSADSGLNQNLSAYRPQFGAFLRQAKVYWDASSAVEGAAAALPAYYCALQLAKAELIANNPETVVGKKLRHGLLHRHDQSTSSILNDTIEVNKGVFAGLYQSRTGNSIELGTQFRLIDLLSLLPEIATETELIGRTRPSALSGYHALGVDDNQSWSLVLLPVEEISDESEPVVSNLLSGYRRAALPENWREVFGVSERWGPTTFQMLESIKTVPVVRADGGEPQIQLGLTNRLLWECLGGQLSPSRPLRSDFFLTHTTDKETTSRMPLSLVRYMVLYVLSSLVRYYPESVDQYVESSQGFLVEAFMENSMVLMLGDSYDATANEASRSAQYIR